MCRTEDHPKGFMIWLAYGEDSNGNQSAGLKGIVSVEQYRDYYDEDMDIAEPVQQDLIDFQELIDLKYKSFTFYEIDWMSWWNDNTKNKTGTAIILLGNNKNEHTFDRFSQGRNFLQSRYLEYKVKPKFYYLENDKYRSRTLENPLLSLQSRCIDQGVLVYESWKVYYYVLKEDKTGEGNQNRRTPLVHKKFKEIMLYKNELYGDYTDLHVQTNASLRNSWGILYKSVGQRVTIIVEPPILCEDNETGVYPNEARSKLSWKDSKDSAPLQNIPLDEVKHYFKKNMPDSILQLIKEESSKESDQSQPSKLAHELKKYLSVPKDKKKSNRGQGILISNLNGDSFGGDSTGQVFNQQGQKNEIVPPPVPPPPVPPPPVPPPPVPPEPTAEEIEELKKRKKAREQAQKFRQEPPMVVWEIKEGNQQFDEWFKRNSHYHICYYEKPEVNNSGNKIRLNTDHKGWSSYMKVVEIWLNKKNVSMTEPDIMKYIIKPYFNEFLPIKIQNAKSLPCMSNSSVAFSVEALSWIITGMQFDLKRLVNTYYNNFMKKNPEQC